MVRISRPVTNLSSEITNKSAMLERDKFLTWCAIKRHLADSSIKHTRIRYDVFINWLGENELNPDSCERFVLYLREKGLRNASINSYIRVLNLIDIFLKDAGLNLELLKKISYFNKQTKVPTFLSVEEIKAIIAIKKNYSNNPYKTFNVDLDLTYRLVIWFLASTGCRFSEMANLTRENLHIGIDNSYVTFKDTKTYLDRQVPIPPQLAIELSSFIVSKKPKDYVFTTSTGHRMHEQVFNPELAKRALLAGLTQKHVYAHCFRNSYIREHRRSGTDILTLCTLVGHKDPKTTLGYDRFNFDEILKGAQNHPLFSQSMPVDAQFEKVKALLESCRLGEDTRIMYEITRTSDSLYFSMRKI